MTKILAIDDQQDNLIVFESILYDLIPDVKVITALTGLKGIEKAETESPDVILLDITMPEIDGFEVCHRLKSNKGCQHIPIILITGMNLTAASRIKGLDLGADAFLSKPIDETELVAQVNVMLRIKKAEDELRQQRDELKKTVQETTAELRLSEKRVRLLLDGTDEGIWSWDIESGEINLSPIWMKKMGNEPGKGPFTFEMWQNRIHPDSRLELEKAFNGYLEGREKYFEFEYQIRGLMDDWTWVEIRGIFIDYGEQGIPLKMLGTHRDITERKRAEELIQTSLREKETLLQEIHHRVKNNMAVIASLLKLQMQRIDDKQVREALKDSQTRVYSMSAVHETLYSSDNMSDILVEPYIGKIAKFVFQSYQTNSNHILLKTEFDSIKLSIDKAPPLGLAINELVSNALKYAFVEDREGEIRISIKTLCNENVEVIVEDNGIGMPKDLDWANPTGLGLQLVKKLVENQLDGTLDVTSDQGTRFVIRIKV